ncbi:MAG: NTP transferase domain-containing protein [Candidatus Lokiarchaeota archaeon]|nr:NTP transferase domain-containing protein [Candidatus Lokiarchaeota archaeon]
MTTESIILAAGYSSRFNFKDNSYKKYLLPFERSTILNYVIVGMIYSGIDKINLIVDAHAKTTKITKSCYRFLKRIGINSDELKLNFIRNDYIERENGYSLFLGINEVESDKFVLSMSDHIFSINIYDDLIKNFKNEDIVLATDPMKIDGYYDLEDCTKVFGENYEIKEIGKKISEYNRLDMGAFIMKTNTIKNVAQKVADKLQKFGVSDILLSAVNNNLIVKYLDFPETIWLDVDNHIEYGKLKKIFNKTNEYQPFNLDLSFKKSTF